MMFILKVVQKSCLKKKSPNSSAILARSYHEYNSMHLLEENGKIIKHTPHRPHIFFVYPLQKLY